MTLKWAMLGLPFGGCKLGVCANPSRPDKGEVIREFAEKARDFLKDRIFTGPDMGTSARDMRPLFEHLGQDSYDVAVQRLIEVGRTPTAKPDYRRILRGIQEDVTGIVAARAAKAAWERFEGGFQGSAVAIQGFGSVGRALAEELVRLGARVVAIADAERCVRTLKGLDPSGLVGPQPGLLNPDSLPREAEQVSREAWIDADADILVPAAIADAIDRSNVDRVQARMIVEAANIPIPLDVEEELHRRNVLVLPDFLVNGGLAGAFGVLVSDRYDSGEAVVAEVTNRIVSATKEVVELAMTEGRSPRKVAQEIALTRARRDPS